ncbi:MAG: hypothetical protein BGO21_01130 [Dyadobacter sp. 50-39]|nr:MAG: hypothetical protein BGO21_01130 [Dyadobacter sp. 50-39]
MFKNNFLNFIKIQTFFRSDPVNGVVQAFNQFDELAGAYKKGLNLHISTAESNITSRAVNINVFADHNNKAGVTNHAGFPA